MKVTVTFFRNVTPGGMVDIYQCLEERAASISAQKLVPFNNCTVL
jgi:hypothetical protein